MQPKGMEDLAVFSAREVKRAAAEERERDQYSSAKEQRESNRRQSLPSKLSESFLKEGGRSLEQKTGERGTERRTGR